MDVVGVLLNSYEYFPLFFDFETTPLGTSVLTETLPHRIGLPLIVSEMSRECNMGAIL